MIIDVFSIKRGHVSARFFVKDNARMMEFYLSMTSTISRSPEGTSGVYGLTMLGTARV